MVFPTSFLQSTYPVNTSQKLHGNLQFLKVAYYNAGLKLGSLLISIPWLKITVISLNKLKQGKCTGRPQW